MKCCKCDTRGLYFKTLRTRNAQQMDIFCCKLLSFILLITSALALTNTLVYYEIRTLQSRNVFIVQALGRAEKQQ
jgi:hypothetical protein